MVQTLSCNSDADLWTCASCRPMGSHVLSNSLLRTRLTRQQSIYILFHFMFCKFKLAEVSRSPILHSVNLNLWVLRLELPRSAVQSEFTDAESSELTAGLSKQCTQTAQLTESSELTAGLSKQCTQAAHYPSSLHTVHLFNMKYIWPAPKDVTYIFLSRFEGKTVFFTGSRPSRGAPPHNLNIHEKKQVEYNVSFLKRLQLIVDGDVEVNPGPTVSVEAYRAAIGSYYSRAKYLSSMVNKSLNICPCRNYKDVTLIHWVFFWKSEFLCFCNRACIRC